MMRSCVLTAAACALAVAGTAATPSVTFHKGRAANFAEELSDLPSSRGSGAVLPDELR